jgi:hypothetical protein
MRFNIANCGDPALPALIVSHLEKVARRGVSADDGDRTARR